MENHVDDEPLPEAEPLVSTFEDGGTRQQLAALTADPDDPFEPEAEVDFGTDFLPSTNPLAPQLPLSLLSQLPPTHSISQSLELLPASFLAQVREQREFEDSIADLREDSAAHDMEHAHTKQEEEEDTEEEARELLYSDPSYNKDKIHAYNIYKNQWTTSGDKKLVVDASQELRRYRRRHPAPLLFSDQDVATEPGNSAAAELYPEYPEYPQYPGHTDRDTHTQHQVGGAQGLFNTRHRLSN